MKKAVIIGVAAAAVAPFWCAPFASAASGYVVKVCDMSPYADTPALGRGWSTQVAGSSVFPDAGPAAWPAECGRRRNNSANWFGTGGGFGDGTSPGATALLRFTPPPGSTITQIVAQEDLAVTSGSYGEAGVFTSAGRALEDQGYHLSGGGDVGQSQAAYASAELGSDGAAGLQFGSRCPINLAPAQQYCGGAGAAYSGLKISIEDPTPPNVSASISIDGTGRATAGWTAADPQSGISRIDVARAGGATATTTPACSITGAPACEPSVSGSTSATLAPGETVSFTVTATVIWGGSASQTVSVSRPADPPPPTTGRTTPAPATTPPPTSPPQTEPVSDRVTLRSKARPRNRRQLSGTARGCVRVRVTTPRGHVSAKVRGGRWSVTVARTRGTYTAVCGAAKAKRVAR